MPREDRAPLLPQHQRALGRLSAPKLKASPAYFDVVASSYISQGFGVVPMTSTIGGSASSTAKNGVKTLQYVQGVLGTKSKLSATKGPPTDLARRTKVTAALLGLVAVGAHARSVGHRKSPLPPPTFPPPRSDRRDACTRTRAALPVTAASGPEPRGCDSTVKYVCQALMFWGGGVSPTQNRVAVQCGAASSVRTSPTPNPEV